MPIQSILPSIYYNNIVRKCARGWRPFLLAAGPEIRRARRRFAAPASRAIIPGEAGPAGGVEEPFQGECHGYPVSANPVTLESSGIGKRSAGLRASGCECSTRRSLQGRR